MYGMGVFMIELAFARLLCKPLAMILRHKVITIVAVVAVSYQLVTFVVANNETPAPNDSTSVTANGWEQQKRESMSYQEIFHAVRDGKTDVVLELIDEDETLLNIMDGNKSTPLTRAFAYQRLELARLLIERGANVFAMNHSDKWGMRSIVEHDGLTEPDRKQLVETAIAAGVSEQDIFHAIWRSDHDRAAATLADDPSQASVYNSVSYGSKGLYNNLPYCGLTPLHYAVIAGDECMAELLLAAGTEVDAVPQRYNNESRHTPMYFVPEGRGDIAQLLIDHGADVNHSPMYLTEGSEAMRKVIVANGAGGSPLLAALILGELDRAEQIIRDDPTTINYRLPGANIDTPLHMAAQAGSIPIAKLLLEQGMNVDTLSSSGKTTLTMAPEMYCPFEMIRFLVENGADIHAENDAPLYNAIWQHAYGHENCEQAIRYLAEKGARPRGLCDCARGGNLSATKLLLELGADVNETDSHGRTALDYCEGAGGTHAQPEIAALLREHGAQRSTSSSSPSKTAAEQVAVGSKAELKAKRIERARREERKELIHRCVRACWADDRKAVKEFLAIDPTIIDEYAPNHDVTVLEAAIWHGSEDLTHWLLDEGASATPAGHETRPFNAASICGRVSVLKRMLDMGADEGLGLAYAARREQREAIRTLLAAGVDPNRKAPIGSVDGMAWRGVHHRGETALHMAARAGDIKAARLLVEGGADPVITDAHGETPMAWFSRFRVQSHNWSEDKLREMADLLTPKTAQGETHRGSDHKLPPLAQAAASGDIATVKRLLAEGTDANSVCPTTGESALHLAATNNQTEIAKLLLSAGADPNRKCKVGVITSSFWRDVPVIGETPLHRAAGYSCRELIVALIEAGADANILDAQGQSGLTWFSRNVNWNLHEDITSRDEVGKMVASDDWKDQV